MKKRPFPPYAGFMLFNFVFFMMDTASGYLSIYLNEIGMTKTNIGMLTAVSALIALLFQPSLGLLADRSSSKNKVLGISILFTAVLYPLILLSVNVFYILLILTLYSILRRCQPSINNSMSLEFAETSGRHYGPIRMMGAVGYALMMAVIGQVSKISTQSTFYAYTAICLMNVLFLLLLPKMQGHQRDGKKQPLKKVFENKTIVKLIAYTTIMSLAQGMYFSFFAIFYTEELGGTNALYGTMLSIAALCEIPFLFYSDRLITKIGTKRMLFIISMLDALRWAATFFVRSPYVQIAIQSMNFLNILMQVAVNKKMNSSVEPAFKTTAQTLSATVQTVVSLLISSFFGGILADLIGLRPLFLMSGALSLAAGLVFYFIIFKDSLSDGAEHAAA